MLKRIGLYTAALFATLALMQLPTASAQNREGSGWYGYNAHQPNSYDQSNGPRNGYGYNRQLNGSGSNYRQQNAYSSNDREPNMRQGQSQFDSRWDNGRRMTGNYTNYQRDSQRYRRSCDDDDRRAR